MPTASRPKTHDAEAPQDPLVTLRKCADALFRSAVECCRQHDRAAKLFGGEDPELEYKHAEEMCAVCARSLAELTDAYDEAARNTQPPTHEDWWRKANTLWHASREYERHHLACDAAAKKLSGKRGSQLSALQMEYELAASSLLALRHAANDYQKTRSGLT